MQKCVCTYILCIYAKVCHMFPCLNAVKVQSTFSFWSNDWRNISFDVKNCKDDDQISNSLWCNFRIISLSRKKSRQGDYDEGSAGLKSLTEENALLKGPLKNWLLLCNILLLHHHQRDHFQSRRFYFLASNHVTDSLSKFEEKTWYMLMGTR